MEAAAIVGNNNVDLTQCIFAVALGRQVILHQLNVVLGDAINRLVDGIDRAVTVSGLCFNFITAGQFDRGGGDVAGAGLHVEVIQTEVLRLFLLLVNKGQRFQVIVKHLTFFVGQLQEGVVQLIHVVITVLITHLFHTVFNRGAAGTGGQVQLHLIQADGFRGHDFVVFTILQDAILVNTGGVREGTGADNCFVGRNRHVANLADGLAGAPDFVVINAGVHVHDVFAHFDRHDHFFQRTVTRAFTYTVHRAFYLTCASVDGGDSITHGQTQIIVGVDGDNCFINIWHAVIQAGDDVGELKRHGVADGVRDVDGFRARVDGGFHNARQVFDWRTARIFTGEFNVIGIVACALNHVDRALNHLIQRAAQFGCDVHRRGGNKGVDTERFGDLQRLGGDVDVFLYAACQGTDAAVFNGARNGLYGFEITRGRDRETDLHHVDTHTFESQRDLQFLFYTQACL